MSETDRNGYPAAKAVSEAMYLTGLKRHFKDELEDDLADNEESSQGVTPAMIDQAESIHDLVYIIERYYADSSDPETYELMVRSVLLGPFLPFTDMDEFRPSCPRPERKQ